MIRTLIVDDHDSMRRVVRKLLERSGDVEIVGEAQDGIQALQAIRQLSPDVIILDIYMKRMDGFEVLAGLEELKKRPKVVMLSMNDTQGVIDRALASGANAFVPKKLAYDKLVDAVKAVVSP